MSPLQQYLAAGALAAEAMRPQRVKDLEAFFRDNPHAFLAVEQIISGGAIEAAPLGLSLNFEEEPEYLLARSLGLLLRLDDNVISLQLIGTVGSFE